MTRPLILDGPLAGQRHSVQVEHDDDGRWPDAVWHGHPYRWNGIVALDTREGGRPEYVHAPDA